MLDVNKRIHNRLVATWIESQFVAGHGKPVRSASFIWRKYWQKSRGGAASTANGVMKKRQSNETRTRTNIDTLSLSHTRTTTPMSHTRHYNFSDVIKGKTNYRSVKNDVTHIPLCHSLVALFCFCHTILEPCPLRTWRHYGWPLNYKKFINSMLKSN